MDFLIENDYLHLIRKEILDVVTNEPSISADVLRVEAETAAEEEITSYLVPRYDAARIFRANSIWDIAKAYAFNDIVFITAAAYVPADTFSTGDLIEFTGSIFHANQAVGAGESPTTNPAKWDLLGLNFAFFQALQTQLFVKDVVYSVDEFVDFEAKRYKVIVQTTGVELPTNTQFFILDTEVVAAGTLPTVTAKWTAGDPRSSLIKRYMVDITLYELHSRINPRNIPDFRIQRRDDAISYLKMIIDPRKNVSPDLPEKFFKDRQGNDVVWDSNTKIDHGQESY